jgi:hypothetical protein
MMKDYLGDGVYAEYDGLCFVLTTEDGVHTTNRIVLEDYVYRALVRWVERVADALDEERERGKEQP